MNSLSYDLGLLYIRRKSFLFSELSHGRGRGGGGGGGGDGGAERRERRMRSENDFIQNFENKSEIKTGLRRTSGPSRSLRASPRLFALDGFATDGFATEGLAADGFARKK